MNDFDLWNENKKLINKNCFNKFYHPKDIWWCYLGLNIGHEQNGSEKNYERPVLILKGFNKNVCLIVPLTTSKNKSKFKIRIGVVDKKEAQAIISQIRLIDTKRLINKICSLDENTFNKIKKAIKELL